MMCLLPVLALGALSLGRAEGTSDSPEEPAPVEFYGTQLTESNFEATTQAATGRPASEGCTLTWPSMICCTPLS